MTKNKNLINIKYSLFDIVTYLKKVKKKKNMYPGMNQQQGVNMPNFSPPPATDTFSYDHSSAPPPYHQTQPMSREEQYRNIIHKYEISQEYSSILQVCFSNLQKNY